MFNFTNNRNVIIIVSKYKRILYEKYVLTVLSIITVYHLTLKLQVKFGLTYFSVWTKNMSNQILPVNSKVINTSLYNIVYLISVFSIKRSYTSLYNIIMILSHFKITGKIWFDIILVHTKNMSNQILPVILKWDSI